MNNDFKNLFELIKTNDENRKENEGVKFCEKLKKIHGFSEIENIENKKIEVETKEIKIENERDLYKFYKNNILEDNKILTKAKTKEITNISVSTIARYNEKLKEKGLIYTKDKSVYLNIETKKSEGV